MPITENDLSLTRTPLPSQSVDELTLEVARKCWVYEDGETTTYIGTPFGSLAFDKSSAWYEHRVSDYSQEAVFLVAARDERPSLWQIDVDASTGTQTITTPFGVLTMKTEDRVTVQLLREDGFVCLMVEDNAKREERKKNRLKDWRADKWRLEFMTRQ